MVERNCNFCYTVAMILPGDILWEQYSVMEVASARAGRAWLTPLNAGAAGAQVPLLLLSLAEPFESPLAEFSVLARAALLEPGTEPQRFKLGLCGTLEFRGDAGADGVALLAPPAQSNIDDYLNSITRCEPGRVLHLLIRLVEKLERDLALLKASDGAALIGALAKLLNPSVLGIYSAGGVLELGVALPLPPGAAGSPLAEAESTGGAFTGDESGTFFAPPKWTEFAAPEVFHGHGVGQAALVHGVGQLARVLLGGLDAKDTESDDGWLGFAERVLGKRDDSKQLAVDIPDEFKKVLAKCLKARAGARFLTLKKLGIALRRLSKAKWAADCGAASAAAPLALAVVSPSERALAPGMKLVPGGSYLTGEKKIPRTLRAFAIDATPVTEKEYKKFLKDLQRPPRPNGPGTRAAKFDEHPVVHATWREAEEFAAHHGKRLPTVYEWEKAARGTDGRKFPYGDTFIAGTGKMRANGTASSGAPSKNEPRGSSPVGSYPSGASPYGVLDMAGNVLEWTSTGRRQGQRLFRALKGACFLDGSVELSRCAGMQYKAPDGGESYVGFRCVKDVD